MADKTNKSKQRRTKNLGKNQTKDHDILYEYIETNLGICNKNCCMGNRGNKYNITHEGDRLLPIREFRLHKIRVHDGKIVCEKKIPLQGNCITCDNAWRKARLENCEKNFKNMTPLEVRQYYIDKYVKDTKLCSSCKEEVCIDNFNISKRMECGLHNMCIPCSKLYTASCADRAIIYMIDGLSAKIKKVHNLSDDHIFPISLGGSNYYENHQPMELSKNLSKGKKLVFTDITEIKPQMLSDRFQFLIEEAQNNQLSIEQFKICMSKAMFEDIEKRKSMTDDDLHRLYTAWNKKNNTRLNVKRCIKKFRQYCLLRFQENQTQDQISCS